jgi:Na+/melibiose symporter-like transporter
MTADCADYETYRSGKYVPGLMGTLFSFIDKMVSSLAPLIASLLLAAIGFKEVMPDVDTPFSPQLKSVGIFLMYGLLIWVLGLQSVAEDLQEAGTVITVITLILGNVTLFMLDVLLGRFGVLAKRKR